MDPLESLQAAEEIRQVTYRFVRCLDLKLWDQIGDSLTEDATVDYGTSDYGKPVTISGRPEIAGFLRTKLGPDIVSVHTVSHPEIDVQGSTAIGIWSLRETLLATRHCIAISGAAYYHDRYERCADDRWRISHIGYVQTCEAMLSLDDLPSFTLLQSLATGQ
jgi:SnoaL-like domain